MVDTNTPKDAATVLLLRPADPIEVFLVRRHGKSKFMANRYVFPGGVCDGADAADEVVALCRGPGRAAAAGIIGDLEPPRAFAHFVAAVRETFEEANVLLAVDEVGAPIATEGREEELGRLRGALQRGETTIAAAMRELGWQLDLAALRYVDHWVTPPIERRRYSARFFLAAAPEGQTAEHDRREVTDGVWLAPAEALRRYTDKEIELAPPTIRLLHLVGEHDSVAAALAAAPHAPVAACAPELVMQQKVVTLVLDGDPLHPTAPGEAPRRFEMQGGRWVMTWEG